MKTNRSNRVAMAAGLLTLLLVLGACATRFHGDKFDKITVGADDRYDVKVILGVPNEATDRVWRYRDPDSGEIACIVFGEDGRVERTYREPDVPLERD